MGRCNNVVKKMVGKVENRYYKFIVLLVLLNPINSFASQVTDINTIDEAVTRTKELINKFYGYTVIFAIAGAVLAIGVIKLKGVFKVALEENYIRDTDTENKKIRIVIIAIVIVLLSGPLVSGVASFYGYVK